MGFGVSGLKGLGSQDVQGMKALAPVHRGIFLPEG